MLRELACYYMKSNIASSLYADFESSAIVAKLHEIERGLAMIACQYRPYADMIRLNVVLMGLDSSVC